MSHTLRKRFLLLFLLAPLLFFGKKANASHLYGADFYYTWNSGTNYTVTLVLYGDCSGAAFSGLNGCTPQVQVFKGTTLQTTLSLSQVGSGVEVTPVCPAQASNTVCSVASSTIPGVMRYTYQASYTLGSTASNWRFHFTGNCGAAYPAAGRSNSITNISNGTIMELDALLNNSVAANSSVNYTTIPTPFFCINKAANYNPGAVDPNGDSLAFALVSGLGGVSYVSPYTATAPMATSAYAFTPSNGQIAFTPNATQRALVVGQVNEYRNGVLVGTSMREMTFVVLNTCNNNPPTGTVSSPSVNIGANTSNSISVCNTAGIISFKINPTDADGDRINVQVAGLPSGATFSITGNNGFSPSATFTWNVTNVTPGVYTFFVTFTDDGCALSSKQTVAYTLNVYGNPIPGYVLTSAANCTQKGKFTLTPYGGNTPYSITITGGSVNRTISNITGTVSDSLAPGTYVLHTVSALGCMYDTTITIAPPASLSGTFTIAPTTCANGNDGSISVVGGSGVAPYRYAIGSGAYSSSNTFTGLAAGTYMIHIRDTSNCGLDTNIVIVPPADIYSSVAFTKPPCNHFSNGSISISAYNSSGPYTYALGTGSYQSSGVFSGLYSGTYTIHIKNSIGCQKDTVVILPDSIRIQATLPITNVLCFGDSNGTITVNANGAYPPYTYAIGTGAFGSSNVFSGLAPGTYAIHVIDTALCYFDTSVTISQPSVLTAAASVSANVSCNGGADGVVSVSASGGTPPYSYSVNSGPYATSPIINGIAAGSYTINVKDANNCTQSATVSITQPTPIVVTFSSVSPSCYNSLDGSYSISASGGTPGYTYAVDALPYQSSGSFTNMPRGTHVLHVKDASGCIKDTAVDLSAPALLVPSVAVRNATCASLSDGVVTVSASGGTPGYTYARGSGAYGTSNIFSALSAGTYVFHVKDTKGCVSDTTISIIDSLTIAGTVTVTNVQCFGLNNGSINASGNGGEAPYAYALGSGSYGSSGSFSPLANGPYVLHIKDVNGCIKDTNLSITQPTQLTVSASATHLICNGQPNGAVTITAAGGTPGYTYAVDAGSYGSSSSFSSLAAGTYTFHAKDANGCIKDTIITINQPSAIAVTIAKTDVLCNGGASGTVSITASGGTPGYTYAIDSDPYSSSNLITGLTAGPHTVHTKDANGCVKDTNITIGQPPVLVLGYTATSPLCNGDFNASISMTGSGGTSPYRYSLNSFPFGTVSTFNGQSAGVYVLHLKDANNCTKDSTITITEPAALAFSLSIANVLCNGGNGSVTVSASGGTPAYSYAVDAGSYSSSNILSSLSAGLHTVHLKDANGCVKDTTISITQPNKLNLSYTTTDPLCFGDANGSISISGIGGTTPYSYAINTGSYGSSNSFSNLSAGSYILHIKDANGCTKDSTITLAQPTALALTATKTDVLCNGGSTGTVTVSASGGISPYSYAADAGSYGSSSTLTGLNAGVHTIHVKDANGCIKDTNISISEPSKLLIGYTLTQPLCYGGSDGAITISASGGTPVYQYALGSSSFGSSGSYTGLTAGTYVLHIKDAKGCTVDSSISLDQPSALGISLNVTNVLCNGGSNGAISVSASGGTPGYTYALNSGAYGNASVFNGLSAGSYTVHLKDSNGCMKDTSITISHPSKLNLSFSTTDPLCFGDANGSITINGIGGVSPYTYALNTGTYGSSNVFNNLAAGTYTLRVKDANECSKDSIITLSQPTPISLSATKTNVLCHGGSSGTVTVSSASGGVPPYTYAVDAGAYTSSNLLTGLTAGIHTIHVKDVNGCIKDTNITITEPTKLLMSYSLVQPLCYGDANGSISISGSGGTPTYQYALGSSSFSTSGSYTGITAGSWVLHLKDANGCTVDSTINLGQPALLGVSLAVTNILCNGDSTGAISVTAAGGTSPYSYALNTGAYGSASSFTGLPAGSYTIHIKDANGCLKDTSFNITQPTKLNLSYTAVQPLCNGGSNGSISINGIGGRPLYTYALNSGNYSSTNTFSGLRAGSDTLHVKDANGCVKDSIILLSEPAALSMSLALTHVKCNGGNSGTVTVTAAGGIAPYTYAVDAGTYSSSNLLTGLNAGTHTVHLKDANGCTLDSIINITEPAVLTLSYTINQPKCFGDANGSISISGIGGTSPYSYAIGSTPFGASGNFSGLSAGSYVLHIKDGNNCTKDSTVTMSEPSALAFQFAVSTILCNGDSASVTVTASGGTSPYTYAVGTGAFDTSSILKGLPAGTYTIHLKDSNGCVKDSTITISQPSALSLSYTAVRPLCHGDTNGSISIIAGGGIAPYTYALNSGSYSSSNVFTGLGAGVDTLHIRDANGCQKDSIINFSEPALLDMNLVVANVLCNGGSTGQVTVTAIGGTGPYQYAVGSGAFSTSNVLTGFAVGTYTIHLKDANGCTKDTSITITEPSVLGITASATNPKCYAGTTGTITIGGSGGTTPYSYALNTGAFSSSGVFTGLAAGTYVLHVRDANGCLKDSTITLTEPTKVYADAAVRRPRCTPLVNGVVTLYARGGTPGYTYAVGTGAYSSSNVFNSLGSGVYTFHVKDTNGCIYDTTIGIQDSVFVHATYTVTNVSCYGGSNGSVTVTPSGGDPAYTYSINTAAYSNTNPIINLSAGAYTLHVKDANGCILDTPLAITQPTPIIPSVTISLPLCNGSSDGSVTLNAVGGTPVYTYAMGTGAYNSSNVFNNISAGTYTMHVKDANGCVKDTNITIGQPTKIVIDSIIKKDLLCFGDNSGIATVWASGGTPSYTYAFDANAYNASNALTGFTVGNHTIHVKDANGCIKDSVVNFKQPTKLYFRVPGITTPTCEGMKDGSVTIAALGGTPGYVYAMDPQPYKTVNIYSGLGEGTYTFRVKDSNGCVLDTSITLVGYPKIVLGSPELTPPSCYGFNNGVIDLNVSGGVAPLTYHVVKPDMTNNSGVFDTLRKGTYTFQIIDSKGCRKDTTLNLTEPDPLVVKANASPNDCAGADDNGALGVYVDGGTQPYAYKWSSGQNTDQVNGVANGAYWVTVVDANLCADSALAIVGYDNCCKPFLPDAFTPNGDGRNDIYRLRWKGDVYNLNFSIYNRFGERVFVSYQPDVGWDGTYHGRPVDLGVYFYVVTFDCGMKEGNRVEYKGDVTLIR